MPAVGPLSVPFLDPGDLIGTTSGALPAPVPAEVDIFTGAARFGKKLPSEAVPTAGREGSGPLPVVIVGTAWGFVLRKPVGTPAAEAITGVVIDDALRLECGPRLFLITAVGVNRCGAGIDGWKGIGSFAARR